CLAADRRIWSYGADGVLPDQRILVNLENEERHRAEEQNGIHGKSQRSQRRQGWDSEHIGYIEVENRAHYRQQKNEGKKSQDDIRNLIPAMRWIERGECKPCCIML